MLPAITESSPQESSVRVAVLPASLFRLRQVHFRSWCDSHRQSTGLLSAQKTRRDASRTAPRVQPTTTAFRPYKAAIRDLRDIRVIDNRSEMKPARILSLPAGALHSLRKSPNIANKPLAGKECGSLDLGPPVETLEPGYHLFFL